MNNQGKSTFTKVLTGGLLFSLSPAVFAATFLFSAPPRESVEVGESKYAPIAAYLTKTTGHKFVYEHPGNWGVYRTKMVQGKYDLVFDGPHFNSYRAEYLKHNIIVKIPGGFTFVGIVRKGEKRIKNLKQGIGRRVCAHAPPNLGTLTLLSKYENPIRQPVIVNTKGWKNIYQGLVDKKCDFAMVPERNLKSYDPARSKVDVIYRAKTLPNQAFSASPRISLKIQQKIAESLTQPPSLDPTETLRLSYKAGKRLEKANNKEYQDVSKILMTEWGFAR